MKRKEEVETMIFTIARRISTLTEHIGNGNTDDFDMLYHAVSEMESFIGYVDELNTIKASE